jgi:hypothetical protein
MKVKYVGPAMKDWQGLVFSLGSDSARLEDHVSSLEDVRESRGGVALLPVDKSDAVVLAFKGWKMGVRRRSEFRQATEVHFGLSPLLGWVHAREDETRGRGFETQGTGAEGLQDSLFRQRRRCSQDIEQDEQRKPEEFVVDGHWLLSNLK